LLVLVLAVMAAGVVGCGKGTPDTTNDVSYKLTHSEADAEYILSWDSIVSRCPDIGKYDKQEVFVRRGESKQSDTGGTPALEMNSPAAWASMRMVMTEVKGDSFRGFGVWIFYFDTDEYLDEYMSSAQTSGLPFKEEGDFMTAVMESGPPTKSVQLHIAGNQFYILFLVTASADESIFFSKEELMELLPTVKKNISSLETTPLPSDIPERVEEPSHQWQEFMTFRSEELPPPVRVPAEQHYNDLIFSDRPLMQIFNFTIDKDWRFVMTATGEVDTKFEVYVTFTSSGEEGFSYSTDQVFSLHSETVTFTREQPLEAGYEPPVNIEVKVFFDSPINWVMTIEK
jgi:hypothetical protein